MHDLSFKRPQASGSKINVRLAYTMRCLLCLMFVGYSQSHANGLLEVVGGASWATGGELTNGQDWGGQLTLGWGGRPTGMDEGSALYGYGAVSLDQIHQIGPDDLGKPTLDRSQIGLTTGARIYQQFAERMRIWFDMGMGYTLDESETNFVGLDSSSLNAQSFTITAALGLQYKIEAKLLFSVGYYQAFFTDQAEMRLAERPLINADQSNSFGRGRVAFGLGWYL